MDAFSDELAESIFNNGLTDHELVLLTAEEIKELAPRIKDRVDLREYIKKLKDDTTSSTLQPTSYEQHDIASPCASSPQTPPRSSSGATDPTSQFISPASGCNTPASGCNTPASGCNTPASGSNTPASGCNTPASGSNTLASGSNTLASGCTTPATENWHLSFKIPDLTAFDHSTVNAIKTGSLTPGPRCKIITQLKVLILQHTREPKKEQYDAVCQALISKYPTCKDTLGNGISSWKWQLRSAFKNFRRDHTPPPDKEGASGPARKRICLDQEATLQSEEEMEVLTEELKEECAKKRAGNKKRIKQIMEITFPNRRSWITGPSMPALTEVFEVYPPLKNQRQLRREFKSIIGIDFDGATATWDRDAEKVIEVGRMEQESRPALKNILEKLNTVDATYENDLKDFVVLELLKKLLYPRGVRGDGVIFQHFETADVDLNDEISSQAEPFVSIIGLPGTAGALYSTYIEGNLYSECKNLREALFDTICLYYVMNIKYSKSVTNILLILQCFLFKVNTDDIKKSKSSVAKFLKVIDSLS